MPARIGEKAYSYTERDVVMFSSDVKVKIAKPLYQRLSEIAQTGGYSSTDEFITHILEKEVAKFADAADEEEVKKQLRGLGYIE